MDVELFNFELPVAKIPCQNNDIFSSSGDFVEIIL